MMGKKMLKLMLLAILGGLCFVASDFFAAEVKDGCLINFSTQAGEINPLSGERSRLAYHYQPGGYGIGNKSNIFSIRPDGSDIIQHTNDEDERPYKYGPAWSPDGTMLAFDGHSEALNRKIIVMSATSALTYPDNIITILDAGHHEFGPVFSPDSTRIAAIRSGGGGGDEIIIFEIASGAWQLLGKAGADSSPGWVASSLSWSPDGDKILYGCSNSGMNILSDIHVIHVETGSKQNLTSTNNISEFDPCWFSNGQYILYGAKPEGSDVGELHVMQSNGTYMQPLTAFDISVLRSPSFSPHGNMIVFSLYDSIYYYGMYIIDINEGSFITLKPLAYLEDHPAWSLEFEQPSVDTLFAYPQYITAGSSTTLFWEISNAYSCRIDADTGDDLEVVDVIGSIDVTLYETTTYTVKAFGLAGSVSSKEIKIIVE